MQVTWGQIVEVEKEQQQLNCGSSSESSIRVKTRRWLGQNGLREVDKCHEHSAGSQTFLSCHKRSNSWHICFVWKIYIWGWVSLMDLFNSETNTWVEATIWWCCVHPWSTNSRWTKSNCERGGQWKRELRKWRWSDHVTLVLMMSSICRCLSWECRLVQIDSGHPSPLFLSETLSWSDNSLEWKCPPCDSWLWLCAGESQLRQKVWLGRGRPYNHNHRRCANSSCNSLGCMTHWLTHNWQIIIPLCPYCNV